MNGVVATAILRRTLPQVKIVGFSIHLGDADFRDQLMATKNFDAVPSKSDGLEKLAEAVRRLVPNPATSD